MSEEKIILLVFHGIFLIGLAMMFFKVMEIQDERKGQFIEGCVRYHEMIMEEELREAQRKFREAGGVSDE